MAIVVVVQRSKKDDDETKNVGEQETNNNDDTHKDDDAPYPPIFVGGTFSLGLLLLIGATIILGISVRDRSAFRDASVTDFVSLGPSACQIQRTFRYDTVDQELNALNRLCIEQWQYIVGVVEDQQEEENIPVVVDTFISSTQSFTACQSSCQECRQDTNKLQGPDYYAGVDATSRGFSLNTNDTSSRTVACWKSVRPRQELSDFYTCGNTTTTTNNDTTTTTTNNDDNDNDTVSYCYQLENPVTRLREAQQSYEFAMMGSYAGYGTGVIILLWAAWCRYRNHVFFRAAARQQQEQQEQQEAKQQQQQDEQLLEEGDNGVSLDSNKDKANSDDNKNQGVVEP